jgi:release factor glutamine methyltransferase
MAMAVSARRAEDKTPRVRLMTLPGVFAPISDSWLLARVVREHVVPGARVLDACTGSGVVGVAAALAGGRVTSVDVSRRAVTGAWLNARLNGTRLEAVRGDLVEPVAGREFDVIASNPPYVPAAGDELPTSGPQRAWDAGRDGRALLDRLLAEAPPLLAAGGVLLVVQSDLIGEEQTLARMRASGLEADVAAREPGPLGPLMRARRDEGLLDPGIDREVVLIVRGRRVILSTD